MLGAAGLLGGRSVRGRAFLDRATGWAPIHRLAFAAAAGLCPRSAAAFDGTAIATGSLAAVTEALRQSGTAFALTLGLRGGAVIDAIGRRVRDAAGQPVSDVVWIGDAGRRAQAIAEAAGVTEERTALRAALDALPLPVWRRAADLALIDCNAAYAGAVDATPGAAIAEAREIGGGVLSS